MFGQFPQKSQRRLLTFSSSSCSLKICHKDRFHIEGRFCSDQRRRFNFFNFQENPAILPLCCMHHTLLHPTKSCYKPTWQDFQNIWPNWVFNLWAKGPGQGGELQIQLGGARRELRSSTTPDIADPGSQEQPAAARITPSSKVYNCMPVWISSLKKVNITWGT